MILWLIRHPAVAVLPGTCYGRQDVALREPAVAALADIAGRLPLIASLRTSPALRCRRVAMHLSECRGLPAIDDDRWQELDFGAWEGRAWNDIPRAESDPWAADHWTLAPPGGESYGALSARVAVALDALTDDRDTAIVTHAGPIRAALALAVGPESRRLPELDIPFGAVIGLRREGAGWARC
ncbi:MAG TPA: histidine phosphatase family protein [Stellaceae bacterium]|nr:histidine phosphatase family protein [Stellaceae bacterium]